MNKLLRDLMVEAQERVIEPTTGEPYDQFSQSRFAELIVRESIRWLAMNDRDKADLLEHFGIQE